jgi:hypothetical protein
MDRLSSGTLPIIEYGGGQAIRLYAMWTLFQHAPCRALVSISARFGLRPPLVSISARFGLSGLRLSAIQLRTLRAVPRRVRETLVFLPSLARGLPSG